MYEDTSDPHYILFTKADHLSLPFSFSVDPYDEEWKKIAKGAMRCYLENYATTTDRELINNYTKTLVPSILAQTILDAINTKAHPMIAKEAMASLEEEYLNYITSGAARACVDKVVARDKEFLAVVADLRQ